MRPERARQYRADLRVKAFAHYGTSCACCGTTERLTIDHIDGDGEYHRWLLFGAQESGHHFYAWLVREGFPPGYQVLCRPCNVSKSAGERCRLWHGDPAFNRCTKCGQVKPLEEFSPRQRHCKPCRAGWMNQHRHPFVRLS